MTLSMPLPQCEECMLRPAGTEARCAYCIAPGGARRDPLAVGDGLPPWLMNTEIDRTRRRSTVEAILRTYRPDEVNWSAVASLLGVSRQAVHQLKRRLVESAARPAEESAAIEEAYAAAQSQRRRRRPAAPAAAAARPAWSNGRTGRSRSSSRSGFGQQQT